MSNPDSLSYHDQSIPESITGGKCSLRPLTAADEGWLSALLEEERVAYFIAPFSGYAGALIEEMEEGEALNMAVIAEDDEEAGYISALPVMDCYPSMPRWRVEFAISERFGNNGLATSAVSVLSDFLLRNFSLPRVIADICNADTEAIRVVEKCGFIRPSHELSYMNYRNVRQGMRYQWYRLQPGRRALLFAKGMQYYRLRRFIDAAMTWLEALAEPRYDDTPYSDSLIQANIGMAYSSAGWYAPARQYLQLAAVMTDDTAFIDSELAWISRMTGL